MENKIVSLKAAKFTKMYKDFYSKSNNNLNLGFFSKKDVVNKVKIS